MSALRLRVGGKVRHQGHRHGDHARITHRRDSRGATRDGTPDWRDATDRHAQHAEPDRALVDGPQALLLKELPHFLEDVQIAREAYEKRSALAEAYRAVSKAEDDLLLQTALVHEC